MTDRPIRALERTLGTLRQLSRDGMQTLEQLTVATGYPRSSLLRLLRSLESVGAVVRDPVDRRYHARLRVVPLAEGDEALRRRTYAAVRELVASGGQTVELYSTMRGQLIMLERHEPDVSVPPVGARIGHPRPRDEIDAVVQVALVSGDEDVSTPRKPYYLDGMERRQLSASALSSLLDQVRSDGVASDLAINGQGVRRHAIALPHLDSRLAGALVIAQTDHHRRVDDMRALLLAWRARLAVTQD